MVKYLTTCNELSIRALWDHLYASEPRPMDTFVVVGYYTGMLFGRGIPHALHQGHLCILILGLFAKGPEQRRKEHRRYGCVQRSIYRWNCHRNRHIVLRGQGSNHPSKVADREEGWYDGEVLRRTSYGTRWGRVRDAKAMGETAWWGLGLFWFNFDF